MPVERWTLDRFGLAVDEWIESEDPPDGIRFVVQEWLLSRFDDPYEGMHREDGFSNLWSGKVPFSSHGDLVVLCTYWIEERDHVVRCDRIASLTWPL